MAGMKAMLERLLVMSNVQGFAMQDDLRDEQDSVHTSICYTCGSIAAAAAAAAAATTTTKTRMND